MTEGQTERQRDRETDRQKERHVGLKKRAHQHGISYRVDVEVGAR